MKATELQCYDLVSVDEITIMIYGVMARMDRVYDTMTNDISAKRCNPIPLTSEILGKNIPFERYWDATNSNPKGSVTEWRMDTDAAIVFVRDFRDKKGEYILEIHMRGSANYGVKKNIYYVHELQQALRLCGLKDLANNFQI